MIVGIVIGFLMVVCFLYTLFKGEYRKEQMTGKESKTLKFWRKMKEFFVNWYKAQRPSMLWGIVILIISIILVVIFCGVYGNNQDNFFYKDKNIVENIDTVVVDNFNIHE